MKPANSVLLLTTLTGFGYGLLAWLGTFAALGILPHRAWLVPICVVVALGLASAGLIASTLHLGRPERAWRAFSQWRSSWLSREGVAAVFTYLPALAFAALWWFIGPNAVNTRLMGLLAAIAGLSTVYCTAMIYASLKPIRQWHNQHTAPDYVIFALFSGGLLFAAALALTGVALDLAVSFALVMTMIAAMAKDAYWRFIDQQSPLTTLASATGLAAFGTVTTLDQPHFTENYILREMGYQIARKHAAKLRRLVLLVGFAAPALLLVLALAGLVPGLATVLAVIFAAIGLFAERWLFFAEATHVAALYYGRPS
jgi:DMSO reductase anchor subunit